VAVRTQPTRSGGFAGERDRGGGRETFSNYGVISPMPMTSAAFAFFLDVCDFPAGGYFSISPHHAPASESGEAEKPNETHHALRQIAEQYVCRARVRLSSEAHVSRIVTNAAKVHRKIARCEI
jgi:hypothetical protein